MQKPIIPETEKERQKNLESYQILDTLPEQMFEDLTLIASQVCQTPIALISLVDKDRQWFKSKYGLSVEQTSRDVSFCAHAINEPEELFEVTDASKDDRFAENPLVKGDPNIRFYAGVPLIDKNNLALGTLCVIDTEEKVLTEEQKKALHALAREVMRQLKLRKKNIELEERSNHFRKNLDNVSGMIFESDTDLNFNFVNQFMSECLQIDKTELLQEKFYSIVHKEDKEKVKAEVTKLLSGEETQVNFEYRAVDGNKEVKWINQSLKVLEDDHEDKKLLGCLIDISDEKIRDKEIAEKTYLLEQSEKLSRVGHWELNLKENTLYWSKETKRIHEVEENYEPNLEEGINFYTKEAIPVITKSVELAISNGVGWDHTLQIITAKGNKRWVRAVGNAEDHGTKLIGVFQDITEEINLKEELLVHQKEIEELNRKLEKKVRKRTSELEESNRKYSKLYHGAPDMMLSIHPSTGKVTNCNKTTLERLGYTREEVVGEKVFKFYHEDCLSEAKEALKLFKKKGKVENKKLIIKTKSGEKIHVSLNTIAVYDEEGKLIRSNSTWRDISELKKAEDQLTELNKNLENMVKIRTHELKSANEELENFTYITTHDIKSPLLNTSGYIEVLEELLENNGDEMVHKSIDWVRKLNQTALNKVEGVIEVVKAKEPLKKEKVELRGVVDEVVEEVRETMPDFSIQLDFEKSLNVSFDRKKLKSILSNLVTNAVKYKKPNEEAKVKISVEKELGTTVIKIKDEGLGVDLEKKRHKLFKMFSRLHDHVEGNGMGLYLVKKILETSGGTIEVESELNKGTTFIITI